LSPVGGNRGVLLRALALREQGRSFALALVTDTEGSTYRKPGALALVADDGERFGAISGGCLEPALDQLARDALASGRVEVALFDTRGDDDLVFGSGSGCRGRMRVLAWPVAPGAHALFDALAAAQADGAPLDLVLAVDAGDAGRGLGWQANRTCDFDAPAIAHALRDAETGLHEREGRRFARPRLLLLGAGPEAPAMLLLANTLGWQAEVVDHREALLLASRLGDATALHHGRPAAVLAALAAAPDAALVMTHVASTDLEALRALATMPVGYVGLLGPPGRRDELLAELTDAERATLQPRLRAPVGLLLGGEGPEAIAMAIAAQLQQFFHAGP
jgi:xanthine dehydrogenase accessory factor